MSTISRRGVLGAGAGLLASTALGGSLKHLPKAKKEPKNIIFCVSDGMAMQTLSMADVYQQVVQGHTSYWNWLACQDFVTNGLQRTRSLSSVVTDSAAASSSWGSGRHIWNGQINMYPDGTELTTLYSLLQEKAHMKTGLVTTTTITHATPSGFAIHILDRDDEDGIAVQHLAKGVDVLFGGGDRFFNQAKRKDKRDVYADFAAKGYQVAKTRDELLGLKSGKALGIFSDSHRPYTVDRDNDSSLQQATPTLAETVKQAIKLLNTSSHGFILQIEGGRVDHGGHANDLAALVYDQIAFEEAVKAAVDFALQDGETLVVITADHATGGPSLNGDGWEYADATTGLLTIGGFKSSYGPIYKAFGEKPAKEHVQDVIQSHLGIGLTSDESQAISDAAAGQSQLKVLHFEGDLEGTLAMVLGAHTRVTWTSQNHTGEHVMVTALGPGSHLWSGVTENVTYFDKLLGLRGLHHSNPTMTLEQAKPFYNKAHPNAGIDNQLLAYDYRIHS